MYVAHHWLTWGMAVSLVGGLSTVGMAQVPGHPVITEVFTDPIGLTDGPVGRDPGTLHRGYIEIYLPATGFDPGLNKDALNLAFYEVEGDSTSSGNELVNYRIDLPTFDLDPSNGITPGAIARPTSGVVVLGWVDYVGNPPTDLAGTPSTRVALINGGITSATDFTFIAINGAQFTGTTNFPVPVAISLINMPNEATSGIIQNGSSAYLLVDRDDVGYVELYDDGDAAHVPPLSNADPSLATGTVLGVSALLDGCAGNDHDLFDVALQPYSTPTGNDIDLETVLPAGGPFSLLVPQIPENLGNGYARPYLDVAKTTEDVDAGNDAPWDDAVNVYRTISNVGPLGPTPGWTHLTTSPAELMVAHESIQLFDVLGGTIGRPGVICANIGGNFAMNTTATPGASSDPASMTFAPGDSAIAAAGQTLVFPTVAASVSATAADGIVVTTPITVDASLVNVGDPAVVNPTDSTVGSYRVLNPLTGLDENGLPFQATAFLALHGLPNEVGVPNEFPGTSLSAFVAANLGGLVDDERHNGTILLDPLSDLSDPLLIDAMEAGMPDDPLFYINVASPAGLDDLVTTILTSAEWLSGASTYVSSFNGTFTAVKAINMAIAETATSGGTFSPTERIHFVDAKGIPGSPTSGLGDVNTTRGFELALIDSNIQAAGGLETGATDDFGLIVQAGRTSVGASVQTGEFIFLSLTGGLEGADVDSLDVPPHANQTVIIYLDLDNLDTVLGCETITRLFVIDAGASGDVNIIEAFSLNVDASCAAPIVTTQPTDQSACDGQAVAFAVVAGGTGPFGYQWRKDGVDIPGATAASYAINPVAPADAGSYDAVVTNACGAATSNSAILTVPAPATITSHPADAVVCEGQSAVFSVTATGGSPLTYQWRRGTTPLVDGGNISGATTATLTLFPVTAGDGAPDYNCLVSSPCPPSAASNNAALTLTACGGPVTVVALGSRYLGVTPTGAPDPIALLLTSPDQPCLSTYVQSNGTLDPVAEFLTPAQWGTIVLTGAEIVPSTLYEVQTETPGGTLSAPSGDETWAYGDTDDNGAANFGDILSVVLVFQGDTSQTSIEQADLVPCAPDRDVTFSDILEDVKAFQNRLFTDTCNAPCP